MACRGCICISKHTGKTPFQILDLPNDSNFGEVIASCIKKGKTVHPRYAKDKASDKEFRLVTHSTYAALVVLFNQQPPKDLRQKEKLLKRFACLDACLENNSCFKDHCAELFFLTVLKQFINDNRGVLGRHPARLLVTPGELQEFSNLFDELLTAKNNGCEVCRLPVNPKTKRDRRSQQKQVLVGSQTVPTFARNHDVPSLEEPWVVSDESSSTGRDESDSGSKMERAVRTKERKQQLQKMQRQKLQAQSLESDSEIDVQPETEVTPPQMQAQITHVSRPENGGDPDTDVTPPQTTVDRPKRKNKSARRRAIFHSGPGFENDEQGEVRKENLAAEAGGDTPLKANAEGAVQPSPSPSPSRDASLPSEDDQSNAGDDANENDTVWTLARKGSPANLWSVKA